MEFFDDITIPYEYLQQPSKLYPLVVIVKTQYKLLCPASNGFPFLSFSKCLEKEPHFTWRTITKYIQKTIRQHSQPRIASTLFKLSKFYSQLSPLVALTF